MRIVWKYPDLRYQIDETDRLAREIGMYHLLYPPVPSVPRETSRRAKIEELGRRLYRDRLKRIDYKVPDSLKLLYGNLDLDLDFSWKQLYEDIKLEPYNYVTMHMADPYISDKFTKFDGGSGFKFQPVSIHEVPRFTKLSRRYVSHEEETLLYLKRARVLFAEKRRSLENLFV